MATDVLVPRLGWSMDEGVFVEWLKRPGERVTKGEMLFVVEGDKAAIEVESLDEGILHLFADGPSPGATVRVGERIGFLLAEGEAPPVMEQLASAPVISAPVKEAVGEMKKNQVESQGVSGPIATPRARRLAQEKKVDWRAARGTGRGGRIRERDVMALLASAPASGIRRTIAERMHESHVTTAPVTLTTTVDVSSLVALRRQFQAMGGEEPIPSYNDLLIKLVALTLAKHPGLNARWEGGKVVRVREIAIGLAVDTEEGLLVPVVRDALGFSVRKLATVTRDLAERARQRRLRVEEMRGGTFTITNLGGFGIDAFTPIIHLPECAILGVGRIMKRPVAVGEELGLRETVTLSLTFDHRVVDGAPAARFLQTLSSLLENPAAALVE